MRIVSLFLIFACLPIFIGFLRQVPHRRAWGFAAIGLMLFVGGSIRINGFFYAWAIWPGPVKGFEVSPIDMMAIALIMTRQPSRGPRLPFWPLFAAYFSALVLALLFSNLWVAASFTIWQFGRLALLFAAIAAEIHRDALRKGLLAGLALGLVLQATTVVLQKLGGIVQAGGTFGHQNSTGMATELAMLPLLATIVAGDRRKLVAAGLSAALIIIAGGGSRGTIGFALGGVALFMILSVSRGLSSVKVGVISLGVLGLALASPLAYFTLKDRFGDKAISLREDAERNAFERAAQSMAADHPLGVGPNQYVVIANKQGYSQRAGVIWNPGSRNASVHNAYLLARAETGWHGEIALILLLLVPAIRGGLLSFRHKRSPSGEIVLGSAVAITTNIVHNNYEFVVFNYAIFALVIINISIVAGQLRAEKLVRRPRAMPMMRRRSPIATVSPRPA